MNRFFKPSWYRGGKSQKRKSAFGGTVASMDEVSELNEKIKEKEAEEFADFEVEFDKKLKKL
ncbi:hypothetical protein GW756_05105 [bacterium]|nr:hypothetical protein [bacterium]NCQ55756.1 hypothetical protein [Candidatus Parcubacteria bacterium]NCS67705.1 hypothetical protein [Candidatus Peregrinibacteria bacterium]NCS96719.1 hypothetical protein [bacterium]